MTGTGDWTEKSGLSWLHLRRQRRDSICIWPRSPMAPATRGSTNYLWFGPTDELETRTASAAVKNPLCSPRLDLPGSSCPVLIP